MKRTILLISVALLAACTHDNPRPEPNPSDDSIPHLGRLLVLNEGGWSSNDASITMIDADSMTVEQDWFEYNNGRGLGDVAQDMIVYGSKAYVTVTFSNSLEAINLATGASTRYDMGNLRPRSIAAHNGKLFISCYLGRKVVVYDTANLGTIVAEIPLGNYQPEGLAVAGGRLFAVSSWISDANQNSYDNKVYVVDLSDYSLSDSLTVGLNPQSAVAIDSTHVAVNYNGDYTPGSAGCAVIDATTLSVNQLGRTATGMAVGEGRLYGFSRNGYGEGSTASYWCWDGTTFTPIDIAIGNPYGIFVDSATGCIMVMTDGNYVATGDVVCFGPDGKRLWVMEAGMLPKKVVSLPKQQGKSDDKSL